MKQIGTFLIVAGLGLLGCADDRTEPNQASQSQAVQADNTGRNERDRDGETKTAGDQSESEADRKITQNIRKSLTDDASLSTSAQNVKIITSDGKVTLRGPVKSALEKAEIEKKAKQVAGVRDVDNQLEVAS